MKIKHENAFEKLYISSPEKTQMLALEYNIVYFMNGSKVNTARFSIQTNKI